MGSVSLSILAWSGARELTRVRGGNDWKRSWPVRRVPRKGRGALGAQPLVLVIACGMNPAILGVPPIGNPKFGVPI